MKTKKLTLRKEMIVNLSNLEMRILKGGLGGQIPLPTRMDTIDPRELCCKVDENPDPNKPDISGVRCNLSEISCKIDTEGVGLCG